jgi:hypothetical protein
MNARLWRIAVAACLSLPAALRAQERVDVELPGLVEVKAFEIGREVTAPPARLDFRHALLLPGRRLRVSVRADGVGGRSDVAAVSFATANPQGGTGFQGRLSGPDWIPVFEGRPLAVSGGVEITWRIVTASRVARAGSHQILLWWRVESVAADVQTGGTPGSGGRGRTGTTPVPLPDAERSRTREGRAARDPIPP